MIRCATILALVMTASAAHAEVFKCKMPDGKIAYQDAPCAGAAASKEVRIADDSPSAEDAYRAQIRSINDASRLRSIEREREFNRQIADIDRDISDGRKVREQERCAEYKSRSVELERRADTWRTQKYRDADRAEAVELKGRHFSECFAR